MDSANIYDTVNTKYSAVARLAHSNEAARESQNVHIASSFGYSKEELASLPSGTNLGLSCGNPLATAHLQPTETMLDLGSGGGMDCLIAANQMLKLDPSPTGKVYGVDRSSAMIALARKNARGVNSACPGLVEFVEAPISKIPLGDETIDLIVSNCVINLVPEVDKPRVFQEMFRLLKPGGRVAISDLLAKKPLPAYIRHDAALLVGCLAGASLVDQYQQWLSEAGFQPNGILFVDTEKDLNVYVNSGELTSCCDFGNEGTTQTSPGHKEAGCSVGLKGAKLCNNTNAAEILSRVDFNEWTASYQIYAMK